jgi:carbonic anhydrase
MTLVPAAEALQRLQAGNARFVANQLHHDDVAEAQERGRLAAAGQRPFAIILGCSDSRVPVELVFDQGLGDLFVIRIAGNIVAPSGIGSVEFAAVEFDVQLVVVMGHSNCGAIKAALDALERPDTERSRNLDAIVSRVRPAVAPLLESAAAMGRAELVERAVEENMRRSVRQLRQGSELIQNLEHDGRLTIAGAVYSLETGAVQFMDERGS